MSSRGPDHNQLIEEFSLDQYRSCLFSSVLDLRGDRLVEQPIIKENDFLQFNGELYEIVNDSEFDASTANDGLYLIDKLTGCTDESSVLTVVGQLRGEFSFIYWSSRLRTVFFGRDYFGRRSLCWNIDSKLFLPDSTDDLNELRQLSELNKLNESTVGFNLVNLEHNFCVSSIAYYDDQHDWTEVPANGIYKLSLNPNDGNFNQISLIRWQSNSFLDSPISNKFNFELLDADQVNDQTLMLNYELEFLRVLRRSVEHRVLKQNFKCRICSSNQSVDEPICNHSCLAVLFSGGLDSTVLALIANEFMPENSSIDLINLAFNADAPDRQTGWSSYLELKRLAPNRKWNFVAIDRTPEQLVDYRERIIKRIIYPLNTVLDDSIGCAMYFASSGHGRLIQDDLSIPDSSHNDQEIESQIDQYPSVEYETTSKVLLLGQGADEQLAGYARHRTTFRIGDWSALQRELNLDINRISYRNLGRDDRMISSNGRESR